MSSEIVLLMYAYDDNASALGGSQVIARVMLCHQVKRIIQIFREEVTWTSNIDLNN